jgi:hypothetical protein
MAQQQFTPGPWHIDPCLHQQIEIERRIKADSLAFPNDTVATVEAFQGTDVRDANASLIAAAPELYGALVRAESLLNTIVQTDFALKALAKARGEQVPA